MATVTLDIEEINRSGLPGVCMKCGTPTLELHRKSFTLSPFGIPIVLLPGFLYVPGEFRIKAPLCHAHRNHWRWRTWTIGGSFLGLFVLGVIGAGLLAEAPKKVQDALLSWVCAAFLVALLIWVIAAI